LWQKLTFIMDILGGAPRVLGYPRPVVVQCGTDATLRCQIGGDPRPDVIWERKNVQILSEGRHKLAEEGKAYLLTIKGVTQQDAGQYICKARNIIANENVDLTSNDKPRFLIKPLSLRVDRGEDAAFSCKIWGTPLPEVTWEKDGKKLHDIFESSHFSVSNQDGGWFQLKIYRTRMPDKGVYTCKAVNCHGEALAGAVLLVEPEPPLNSSKVKKFAVTEGKHAKFRCCVTGKPKPEIIWKKDGVPLDPGRRHLIFEDREGYYTLKVLYCKVQDTGLYVCAASNALGNTLSAVHLSVKGSTVRFRLPLKDVEVKERDAAVLECEVPDEMIPAAWYLEDQRLMPNSKYGMEQKGTRRRLIIHDAGTDDDGVYLCEMPDGAKTIAELSVKGTIVRKLPRKLEVLEGENAAFYVEVENDDMEVHWFKDGLQLLETHQTILKSFGKTHILVFVNVAYHDSGVVTFVAGRSKTSSRLKVKGKHCPPICPLGVKMDVDRPNSALLTWVPAPNSQTTTRSIFVLERKEVGSQEWQKCFTSETATSAEVTGDSVPCEGNYRFRVSSINKYGRSGHVEFPKVVHLVPGPKILCRLQDCETFEGEDVHLSIELSAPMLGNWFLNSLQLQHGGRYSIQHNKTKHSLVIHEAQKADDTAEITFIANGVRDSAVLKVKPAVVKFTPLSESDISWLKDGKELQATEGLNIQSEGNMRRIVILSADESHSGVYTCETSEDSIKFNVDVAGPPVEFSPVPEEELHKSTTFNGILRKNIKETPTDNITLQAEGTMRRLIIRSAETADAGSYTCQAGNNSMEFTVNIKEPPVTLSHPKNIPDRLESFVGEPVVLEIEVSRPTAEVKWWFNGKKIEQSNNITIIEDGLVRRLTIKSPMPEDSGKYTCDATDDKVDFQVKISEPPVKILRKSEIKTDLKFLFSDDIVLECELSRANGKAKWYKDGYCVEGNERFCEEEEGAFRSLVILNAELGDSGEYFLDVGEDSIGFKVAVEEPPVLFVNKEDGTVVTGYEAEGLTLTSYVSKESATVRWLKDWTPVEGERFKALMKGNERTLTIDPLRRSDAGEYTCDVNTDQIHFSLLVKGSGLHLILPLTKTLVKNPNLDMVAHADGMVTLRCEVCKPKADVQWLKNGIEVVPSRRFSIRANGVERSLTIHRLTQEDAGQYTCESRDDQTTATLRVEFVEFLTELHNTTAVTAEEFGEATLETEISLETGEVQWMRQGVVIQSSPRHTLGQNGCKRSLTIHNLTMSDRGTYRCETLHDRTQVKLNIEPRKISIRKGLTDQETFEREAASFEVELSHTEVEGIWQKDGIRVKPNNQWRVSTNGLVHGLTLSNLTLEDTGTIVFSAEGVRTTARLTVKETPVAILKPLTDVRVEEELPATLECEFSRQNVGVRWFKNGSELKPGKNYRIYSTGRKRICQILQCSLADSGFYKCDTGELNTSCSLEVYEHKLEMVHDLEDLYIQEDQNAVFMCEVSLADVIGDWYKDGHKIRPSSTTKIRTEGTKHFLLMCNVKADDAGEIRFVARDVESTAYLEVEELPLAIVKPLRDRTALEKHRVILECTVSSPHSSATWYKDKEELVSSDRVEILEDGCIHKLVIQQATVEDEGTYMIEVGEHTSKAKLMVEGKLKEELHFIFILGYAGYFLTLWCFNAAQALAMMKDLKDVEVTEPELASFQCEVSVAISKPPVWTLNGVTLRSGPSVRLEEQGTVHKLILKDTNVDMNGTVKFTLGKAKSSATLTVRGK
uniref:Obscurin like cytoskeletal adaptor 1a n=1 Tax=Nothobranchius furzeri TaxID=105023 RepID=A0A8C6KGJ0_NOTFU